MTDVFDQNTGTELPEDKDFVTDLVGEGKKYKTNNDLAKSVIYGQNHILTLEEELKQLREEVKTRKTIEDFTNQIKNLRPNEQPIVSEQHSDQQVSDKPGLTQADVEKLLSEREAKVRYENNLQSTVSKLTDKFGDQTASIIAKKAQDLGVSKEHLREVAKTTPGIFLALFDNVQNASRDVFNAPTQGKFLPQVTLPGEKWSDFQRVKKENKKLYESPAFQTRLFKAAESAMNQGRYDEWKGS